MRLLPRQAAQSGARPQWRPIPAWSWMLGAVIAVAVTAFVITTWLLAIAGHAKPGTDQANARLDAVRTGLAAGAGAGAAVGLMLAFRRQHHQEISTALTDYDAAQRRITELYSKSVEQLGSEKAPVRLGGLYALERLAQDNPDQRQTIIDVTCAYLRMPFPVQAPDQAIIPADKQDAIESEGRVPATPYIAAEEWEQEKQVRLTAQRILAAHLRPPREGQDQADASPARFWDNIRLDLIGATLIDFDFVGCTVTGAGFERATFSGDAWFVGATFSDGVGFGGAAFSGDARFEGATFSDDAGFAGAAFNGDAWFEGATFSGAAWFAGAAFNGDARFDRATFSDDAGFGETAFNGNARFARATFSSAAVFGETAFNGNAWFVVAAFNGNARFAKATFSSAAVFDRAAFSSAAVFEGAAFSSAARFDEATFSGDAVFEGATFEQGADSVSFTDVTIKPSGNRQVWPEGWQLQDNGTGGFTVARINDGTASQ